MHFFDRRYRKAMRVFRLVDSVFAPRFGVKDEAVLPSIASFELCALTRTGRKDTRWWLWIMMNQNSGKRALHDRGNELNFLIEANRHYGKRVSGHMTLRYDENERRWSLEAQPLTGRGPRWARKLWSLYDVKDLKRAVLTRREAMMALRIIAS